MWNDMPHVIFLSHSSHDRDIAATICAALEKTGIGVWMAPRDIQAGDDWGASIINAINTSRVMVLIFTSWSNESPQVIRELERAVAKGVRLLPVRVDNVNPSGSMEYFLGTTHWLDAFSGPLENHLPSIIKTVEDALREGKTKAPLTRQSEAERPRFRWGLRATAAILGMLIAISVSWYIFLYPRSEDIKLALDLQRHFTEARQSALQGGKPDFTPVERDVNKLFALNPDSGYALYYQGELERLTHQSIFTPKDCLRQTQAAKIADLSLYENDFYRYLDNATHLPPSETGGDTGVTICYARPLGYCEQRTAWVNHLLAIDLYYEALATHDPEVRKSRLVESLGHAKMALEIYPPHGFSQCVPTDALVDKLHTMLADAQSK